MHNKSAVRAGATISLLPEPIHFINAKVIKATLSFKPLSAGIYYLVLDNGHSGITAKNVILKTYWIWTGSPLKNFIKQRTKELNWNEVWTHLLNAEKALEDNRLPDCCNNLRLSLITIWMNVCTSLEKKSIPIEPGKTPDISLLTKTLTQHGTPDYISSLIARIWSLDSELAHVEKRAGKPPPTDEVVYAYNLTLITIAHLLSTI